MKRGDRPRDADRGCRTRRAWLQVFNLLDTGLEHIELGVLVKTYGEGGHVAAVHAAVGEEAFERNHEALRALVDVLPAGCDESTHVDQTVLFDDIVMMSAREHLLADLLDGGVFVTAGRAS